jgi:hypothetical protein
MRIVIFSVHDVVRAVTNTNYELFDVVSPCRKRVFFLNKRTVAICELRRPNGMFQFETEFSTFLGLPVKILSYDREFCSALFSFQFVIIHNPQRRRKINLSLNFSMAFRRRTYPLTNQAGRSRVSFPMGSLRFFIDLILPVALWPWGRLSL